MDSRSFGARSVLGRAIAFCALSVLVAPAIAHGQLSISPGFNGPVQAISNPDSDGTRYLGGEFTAFNAWDTGGGAVVASSTGEVDLRFPKISQDAGNGTVLASVPDGSGGFYIGGEFNCLGPNLSGGCDGAEDLVRNNAAHIGADGTVSSWNPAPNGPVYAIERAGTTVYIGGGFSCLGPNLSGGCDGEADFVRNNAAAVGTDGSPLDWDPNVVGGSVRAIAPAGSTVYLGGGFSSVGGDETRGFAAAVTDAEALPDPGSLDPTWDPIFVTGGGADGVKDIEVAGDMVYIGGSFFVVDGENRVGLVAVGSDGTLSSWNPGLDVGSSQTLALEVSGDTVYVGGTFSSLGGQPRNNLGAVTTAGAITNWDPEPNATVDDLTVEEGTAFISGTFTAVSGEPRNGAAAVATDDGAVQAWDPNPKGVLFTLVQSLSISGSSVYVGGNFDTVGGDQRNRLAAVNERGVLTSWDPGAIGPATEQSTPVRDIAVSGDTVYLGGDFSYVGGEVRNNLAAVGTDGVVETFDPSPDETVFSLDMAGGILYLGGIFGCLGPNLAEDCGGEGDSLRTSLAAVDSNGAVTPWNPNVNGPVAALEVSSGTVYFGGTFSQVNSETRNSAAAVGTDGTVSAWNPNANGPVYTLDLAGGQVYLGGAFSEVAGQTRNNIASVGTGGTLSAWNPNPNGAINRLGISGDMVYLAGDFYCLGPTSTEGCAGPEDTLRNGGLAAVGNDGSISSWYPEPNNAVSAVVAEGDTVYLGGYFDSLGGMADVERNRSAAVSVTGAILGRWPSNGRTLTANQSGTGTGTVTSSPAGIDCGSQCSELFGEVRPVTLTATPETGSRFTGWSGACSGMGTCEVSMDEARNVTAEFTETFELSVSRSGTGSGTVTSSPAGIACGADCSEAYDQGEVVTLTASAAAGSTFSGWSGACSGNGTCQVTMDGIKSVTAQFATPDPPDPPALGTLSVKGPSNAKRGRKVSYKVTIRNTGGATATGLAVKAQGKGVKASKSSGSLVAGKSRTISLPIKFKKKGKVKVTFTVTSANAGKKSATKTIRVR